jgi:hypothetical protein
MTSVILFFKEARSMAQSGNLLPSCSGTLSPTSRKYWFHGSLHRRGHFDSDISTVAATVIALALMVETTLADGVDRVVWYGPEFRGDVPVASRYVVAAPSRMINDITNALRSNGEFSNACCSLCLVAGVVVTVTFVVSTVYVLRRRTGCLRMAAYDFSRRYGTAALWLLPCGRWGPELPRKAFGQYVFHVGARHKRVAAVPLLQAAVVGLLSAFGGSAAACVAQWVLLGVMFASAALLYAARALLRVPAWGVLEALISGALAIADGDDDVRGISRHSSERHDA